MESETYDIKCDIFRDAAAIIKKARAKIKVSKNSREKQYYAQDILLEAETLLSCSNFSIKNPNCKTCRFVSHRNIEEYKKLAINKIKKLTKRY